MTVSNRFGCQCTDLKQCLLRGGLRLHRGGRSLYRAPGAGRSLFGAT